jgi:hypothetical protein
VQAEATEKHPFYLAAILIGVIALISGCYGQGKIGQASRRQVVAMKNARLQNLEYTGDAEVKRLLHAGDVGQTVGLILSLSCLACMTVARLRREPGFYSIPLMLFFASLLMSVILV